MKLHCTSFRLSLVASTLLAAGATSGTAAILVNESYSYSGVRIDGQTMNSVATNAGTGLSGSYTVTTTGPSSALYSTSNLSFTGTAASQGGSVILTASHSTAGTDFSILAATLSGSMTGTLYESFLFRKSTDTFSGNGDALFTRLSPSVSGSAGAHFTVQGESAISGGTAVGYDNTPVDSTPATTLTLGSTYLMMARFTNVGIAGGGTATMWIFDEAAYANWRTLGGANEANLGTYAIRTATDTSATQADFNSNFFHVAVSEGALNAAGTITGQFDEIRLGTSLIDVATVPEPSVGMLLLTAIGTFFMARRRKSGVI